MEEFRGKLILFCVDILLLRFSENKITSSAILNSASLKEKRDQEKILKKQKTLEQNKNQKEEKRKRKIWKKFRVSFSFLFNYSKFPVDF